MIRRIIDIDDSKCNGCGACVVACHEGAIAIVNGKAQLMRDDYCDGLGDCLPQCPTGAIAFIEREAASYDKAAVMNAKRIKASSPCSCPGTHAKALAHKSASVSLSADDIPGCLSQWPVQIRLAPVSASYFNGADLLIAADCTAYAFGDFHRRFIDGRVTLIGCPKLDATDYSEKLTAILEKNDIRTITLVRMGVPCCGGLEFAAKKAVKACGKAIQMNVVTVAVNGSLIN